IWASRPLARSPDAHASDPVLVHWLAFLLHASFRPHLTVTPLRFAITSPLSGCEEDFHLQAVEHARRTKKKRPRSVGGVAILHRSVLELVPEELVVYLVVKLDFGHFYDRPKSPRATIGGGAFQFSVASLDVGAEKCSGPFSLLEVFQRGVNIIREVALRGT